MQIDGNHPGNPFAEEEWNKKSKSKKRISHLKGDCIKNTSKALLKERNKHEKRSKLKSSITSIDRSEKRKNDYDKESLNKKQKIDNTSLDNATDIQSPLNNKDNKDDGVLISSDDEDTTTKEYAMKHYHNKQFNLKKGRALTVGRCEIKDDYYINFRNKIKTIYAEDLFTLKEDVWINGDIIDAFGIIKE